MRPTLHWYITLIVSAVILVAVHGIRSPWCGIIIGTVIAGIYISAINDKGQR